MQKRPRSEASLSMLASLSGSQSGLKMVLQTEELTDGQNIANTLMENVVNNVMKAIGVRTVKKCTLDRSNESFEGHTLQTPIADDNLNSVALQDRSIEKIEELNKAESFNINTHLSELIFPSLPDLCCSLSATSKQGEGDYQPNTIREAAAFYQLGQYNRQASSSSMITETSNSDIVEVLQEKLCNLSFDTIHLSDCETDEKCAAKTSARSTGAKEVFEIPGQVSSESDVPYNEKKDNFLQQSQKFCQFNNKQYFSLNTTVSTTYCTFVNEDCEGEESEINNIDEDGELLSQSSNELVNVERDSEEILIPVRRLIQTNPIICSTTQSSSHLSSPCFPDTLSDVSVKDLNSTNVIAVDEPVKGFSNWEEAVEIQINVTEPVKSYLQNLSENNDIVETKQYWSSIGLMNEVHIDPTHLGPIDVPGIETIPGVKRVDVVYPRKETKDQILNTKHNKDDEDEPSTSNKGLTTDANVNYLSFANNTGKEKKKSKFVSRVASVFSGLLRSKKKNNNKF